MTNDAASKSVEPAAGGQGKPDREYAILGAVVTGCLLFFSSTGPRSAPSLLLIVGFAAVGLLGNASARLVLRLTGLGARLCPQVRSAVLWAVTVLPVLLLMLQSLGQLESRDVLVLFALFVLGVFYMARLRRI